MSKKIEKFTVNDASEETECENCGDPLRDGDVAFLVHGYRIGCGHFCASRLLDRTTDSAA